jgi:hypothetical protein
MDAVSAYGLNQVNTVIDDKRHAGAVQHRLELPAKGDELFIRGGLVAQLHDGDATGNGFAHGGDDVTIGAVGRACNEIEGQVGGWFHESVTVAATLSVGPSSAWRASRKAT